MNVLILAAGYGVRLHPVTHTLSKALIEIGGKPMIEHVVEKFSRFGAITIVTNRKFAGDFELFQAFDEERKKKIQDDLLKEKEKKTRWLLKCQLEKEAAEEEEALRREEEEEAK